MAAAAVRSLARRRPPTASCASTASRSPAERVRAELRAACAERAAPAPPDVIVASVWQGYGHEPGRGPLPAGLPIGDRPVAAGRGDGLLGRHDAHVRDRRAAGARSPRRRRWCAEALEAALAATRPGVTGRELHDRLRDVFEAAGHRPSAPARATIPPRASSSRSATASASTSTRRRRLGQLGRDALLARATCWPSSRACGMRAVGGVRFEDLLLVTDEGCETLTEYPLRRSRPDARAYSGSQLPGSRTTKMCSTSPL